MASEKIAVCGIGVPYFLYPSQKYTITVDFMTNKMNKFSRDLYHYHYTNNTIYTDTLRDYLFLPPPTPPEVFIFISGLHHFTPEVLYPDANIPSWFFRGRKQFFSKAV